MTETYTYKGHRGGYTLTDSALWSIDEDYIKYSVAWHLTYDMGLRQHIADDHSYGVHDFGGVYKDNTVFNYGLDIAEVVRNSEILEFCEDSNHHPVTNTNIVHFNLVLKADRSVSSEYHTSTPYIQVYGRIDLLTLGMECRTAYPYYIRRSFGFTHCLCYFNHLCPTHPVAVAQAAAAAAQPIVIAPAGVDAA